MNKYLYLQIDLGEGYVLDKREIEGDNLTQLLDQIFVVHEETKYNGKERAEEDKSFLRDNLVQTRHGWKHHGDESLVLIVKL